MCPGTAANKQQYVEFEPRENVAPEFTASIQKM